MSLALIIFDELIFYYIEYIIILHIIKKANKIIVILSLL
jgi:hypothetical protein